MKRVVVVGAGLAGLRCAQELRRQGFDGPVSVVGAEPHPPYDRPPLSKALLAGKAEPAELTLLPEPDRAELAVDWRLGVTVAALEPGRVVLADGEALPADGIVLATGARPRRLAVLDRGWSGPGVHTLRTVEDALALRALLRAGARLVIAGAGLIGSEVAAVAQAHAGAVHLVEAQPEPYARLFPTPLADRLRARHAEHGVHWHLGTTVTALGGAGRLEWVELSGGARLATDALLVSVGAEPVTDFLTGSPIACEDGVLTDEYGRTTVPGVVAVGDVARYRRGPGTRRYEHWTNARDMPPVAVAALLGSLTPYDPVPYFWSDQYGHHLQVAGVVEPGAPVRAAEEPGVWLQHRPQRPEEVTAVAGWDGGRAFHRWRKRLRSTA